MLTCSQVSPLLLFLPNNNMGWGTYSCETRSLRAAAMGYATEPVHKTFVQQTKRVVHELMDSRGVVMRECRDSDDHPHTVPIVLALDVTGSMGTIPRQLIADGLPTLMSSIIQGGCTDAALLFLAIGDHEYDRHPVQIAQFESGDAELDMWLTRTYLEGGGGSNPGESYPLAWEFAANRVESDAWDKRKEKGFLFTIGDEPFLKNFPASAFREIYGENSKVQSTLTAEQLYADACKKFEVFHISVNHGSRRPSSAWTDLMGQNHVQIDDHNDVPATIARLILERATSTQTEQTAPAKVKPVDENTAVPPFSPVSML